MQSIFATTTASIFGSRNAWSLAPIEGFSPYPSQCVVRLEIQGDKRNGYNLVMSPEGFFTADSWHPTQQDALDSAYDLFHVPQDAWSEQDASG